MRIPITIVKLHDGYGLALRILGPWVRISRYGWYLGCFSVSWRPVQALPFR